MILPREAGEGDGRQMAPAGRPVTRVLIAAAAPAVREALAWAFDAEPDFTVAGTATGGSDVITAAGVLRPELVILEIDLPGPDGFAVARLLAGAPVPPCVVLLSLHDAAHSRRLAAACGAAACLAKSEGWPELIRRVRLLLSPARPDS